MQWESNEAIPRGPAAVLASLALAAPRTTALQALGDEDWQQALAFCDRAQLTLLLGTLDASGFPRWVRQRLARNFLDHSARTRRLKEALFEIRDRLRQAGVDFVVLKGMVQWPRYVQSLRFRVQYDIDLYCPPGDGLQSAAAALAGLGYRPANSEKIPIDHLPTLVKPNGWQWSGNWFDPQMPIAVDLHFRFWDETTERFPAPGTEQFWDRRITHRIDGVELPVLDPADALAYCCVHALRHWLRGSLKPAHIHELAYFLHTHAEDDAFWDRWRELHNPELRSLQAICFRLAIEWFDCRVPGVAAEEIGSLPPDIALWFERYAASAVEAWFQPRKDELWLHMCLLRTRRDKLRVLRRRLLPARVPAPMEAGCVPVGSPLARAARYAAYLGKRASFHARSVLPALWMGLNWKRPGLERPFFRFLGAALLLDFGLFVFFLLYNLLLLQRGLREDALGWIAGAFTAGTVAGALPAGVVIERLGLARALRWCFAGLGAVSILRTVAVGRPALLASAFAGGLMFALWAVALPPAVTRLTGERARPLAFSVVFGAGIGMGILGGLIGGRLPQWLGGLQPALLAGCACMLLAGVPARRLSFRDPPVRSPVVFPRSGFIVRFLVVLVFWGLATGSFNPFFNAYFARLHTPVERIGAIFAASQFAQMCAVLCAPLALKRLGLIRGIAGMQLATAAGLGVLAAARSELAAAAAYVAYMSAQYMSEPGLYSLLMGGVGKEEQAGASSLNFLVLFSAQALAAAAAGAAFTRFSYPAVMGAAAALAAVAALLLRLLVRSPAQSAADTTQG